LSKNVVFVAIAASGTGRGVCIFRNPPESVPGLPKAVPQPVPGLPASVSRLQQPAPVILEPVPGLTGSAPGVPEPVRRSRSRPCSSPRRPRSVTSCHFVVLVVIDFCALLLCLVRPGLSWHVWSRVISCLVLPCLVRPNPVQFCLVVSCRVLPNRVRSNLVL
jgi:hypothetical protein